MELLTNVLSEMYEHDQNHKNKEPLQTLKERLGIGGPAKEKLNG